MSASRAVATSGAQARPNQGATPPSSSIERLLQHSARLSVVLVIVLLGAGWSALGISARSTAALERITTAQSHHQRVDMLHDTIRSTTLDGALATTRGDGALARTDLAELDGLGRDTDRELAALAASPLPADLVGQIVAARRDMADYVAAAGSVLQAAIAGDGFSPASFDGFVTRFDTLEEQLAAITDRFAADAEGARRTAASTRRSVAAVMGAVAALAATAALSTARRVRRAITHGIAEVTAVATRVAAGELDARCGATRGTEIDRLGEQVNRVADSLQDMVGRLRADADQSSFVNELAAALDMADTEHEVFAVTERAMVSIGGAGPMELLLADSSQAHLERAATHPVHGGAGCGVESPFGCAAVRRGSTAVFRSSDSLDACPKLVGRSDEPLTAVCAPVSFMGRSLGVLHVTRPASEPVSHEQVDRLGGLATAIGARIGTVRAFERSQLQASTDSLTGLMNRRSMEERLTLLIERRQRFALAVADLDHFKALNDTYGHHTGDRALGLFAEVLRTTTRVDDVVARWGGEEFTVALPDLTAADGQRICERVREALALACTAAGLPTFTASFGIADSSAAATVGELFAVADAALYAAKDGGRNRTMIGPPAITAATAAPEARAMAEAGTRSP